MILGYFKGNNQTRQFQTENFRHFCNRSFNSLRLNGLSAAPPRSFCHPRYAHQKSTGVARQN
ncbi:hypothetical protein MNBD_ALPHA02-75 [hydrothermal vent metagenome]|uniref:Uncharacterized protein n=1 Tax=hydrothermal vent metagenome TaxID=652676 RepID=A0A3B0R8P6_9ZZZZ